MRVRAFMCKMYTFILYLWKEVSFIKNNFSIIVGMEKNAIITVKNLVVFNSNLDRKMDWSIRAVQCTNINERVYMTEKNFTHKWACSQTLSFNLCITLIIK